MEPLTAAAIVTLALTKVFETSIEKFTEAALSKTEQMRKKIWHKFRGNTNAENALAAAEQGEKADLDKVAAYLQVVMNEEPELIQRVQEGEACYKIHRLIREFLQGKLTAVDGSNSAGISRNLKQAFAAAMVEIAKKIPYSATLEDIESVKIAIPHLEEVTYYLDVALSDGEVIWPFVGLGRFYKSQGLYSLALPWYEQCVAVAQARLGEAHPDVAGSISNLAGLYKSQGRYREAEPLYQQALALKKAC